MLTARKVAPRTIPQEAVTQRNVYTVGSTLVCSTYIISYHISYMTQRIVYTVGSTLVCSTWVITLYHIISYVSHMSVFYASVVLKVQYTKVDF